MEAWRDELYHYGVKGMRWKNRKEFDKVVTDTMRGNYGNGADRQRKLGDDYYEVQSEVNRRMLGRESEPKDYLGTGFKKSASARNEKRIEELRKGAKVTSHKTSTQPSQSQSKKKKKKSSYDVGKAVAQFLFGKKKR